MAESLNERDQEEGLTKGEEAGERLAAEIMSAEKKTGLIETTRIVYGSKTKEITDEGGGIKTIKVQSFAPGVPVAVTGCTVGKTISLGHFEFARISVSCFLPCYIEQMSEAFEAAKDFAESGFLKELDALSASLKKRSTAGE